MISRTFNRYIWLLNTLILHKRLTFEEISNRWDNSRLSDGKPLALRTFHTHRDAIFDLFEIEIKCDTSTYEYYVSTMEPLRKDMAKKWLLNSFTLSNMIEAGHKMKDRILFEEIPHGTEYLQTVIDAMLQSKELEVDYQSYYGHRATYHMHPYAMKVYNQRWYVVGYIREKEGIRNIALDRTLELTIGTETFVLPDDFDAEEYYANTVGIFVNENQKPQKVVVRVFGKQVEYMRSLPLHHTQEEIKTVHEEYSDFRYKLCLTPELSTHLLAMGEKVKVLEPEELKSEIRNRLLATIQNYE